MKKICFGLSMLFIWMGLVAQTGIKSIRAEDYQTFVCRVVLDLSKDTPFTVQQKADGLQISFANFDGKDAKKQINSSLVREVKVLPNGVWIGTVKDLSYETMRLSETRQAVIDLFTSPSSWQGRLAIARFYSDRGKYASADNAFYAVDRDFPANGEILYYWGVLLKRRGSSRANDKLRAVPSDSAYYMAAQELLQAGSYIPPITVVEDPPPASTDSLSEAALRDSIYQVDSLIVAIPRATIQHPKAKLLDVVTDLASRHFILTLLLFVSTLVILSILIFGRKHKPSAPPVTRIGLEAQTLRRMVSRLLADGWTHKEIARELKINLNDVAQIASLPQQEADKDGRG